MGPEERDLPDMDTDRNQPPSNHYQPPSNHYQPPVTRNQDNTSREEDSDGLRRPKSFVERIRNAENSDISNPVTRDSQLWSYTNPNVRKELQTRGQHIKSAQPDKDVDSAFNFLETYN